MAKKLDPLLIEILTRYGERVEDATWDCHGVWVVYHKAIERIAAKADIVFEMPVIVEANGPAKSVAICVKGKMGDNEDYREEWSFGEASAANCKNSYFYAMAEKRAKDRVVLKLIGLHGLAFSEEESDDFKQDTQAPGAYVGNTPIKSSAQLKRDGFWPDFERELDECDTLLMLGKFREVWRRKALDDGWSAAWKGAAKDRIEGRERAIMNDMEAAELSGVPLEKALKNSVLMAG